LKKYGKCVGTLVIGHTVVLLHCFLTNLFALGSAKRQAIQHPLMYLIKTCQQHPNTHKDNNYRKVNTMGKEHKRNQEKHLIFD